MLYTNEAINKRKQRAKKVKSKLVLLVYIILIPMLIYNISLIAQTIINPNKTPSFFGIKTYVIISGSMQPELNIGDIVIVKDISEELEKGDIISFRQGQTVVTHRISRIETIGEQKQYKTRGDNNNTEDSGTIKQELIEGKVVGKIPYIGKLTLLLQGKMSIIVILVIFIYRILENVKREKMKESKKDWNMKEKKQLEIKVKEGERKCRKRKIRKAKRLQLIN